MCIEWRSAHLTSSEDNCSTIIVGGRYCPKKCSYSTEYSGRSMTPKLDFFPAHFYKFFLCGLFNLCYSYVLYLHLLKSFKDVYV